MNKRLILIGAGGYAKSVIDSIDKNYDIVGFIDEYKLIKEHLGYPILGNSILDIEGYDKYAYFISIGDNISRKRWFDRLEEKNLEIINVIDKTAIISSKAKIGKGCFLGKMTIVNSNVEVGDNCIINTKALIEHGCSIKNHVNVSTNSVLNGDVKVGDGSFIGSCSVVNGQLLIGEWTVIGSGAAVIRNIPKNTINVGVPTRIIGEVKDE